MIYQPLLDTQAEDSSQMTTQQANCMYQKHSLTSRRHQCPSEMGTDLADAVPSSDVSWRLCHQQT